MKKIKRIAEDVSISQLSDVDAFADKLWQNYDIDVEFTKHFVERVNDPRNGIPGINSAQLIRLLRKEYEKYGDDIADMDAGDEAVMKDTKTSVNMPFVMNKGRNGKTLVAKTIMKKKDFKTPDPEFVVNEVFDQPLPFTLNDNDNEYVSYIFKTRDGIKSKVLFVMLEGFDEDEDDIWELAFEVGERMDKSGERGQDAYSIFATVVAIVKEFIRTHPQVERICFQASTNEPSRKKLYDRMAGMMPRLGFKLETSDEGMGHKYYEFYKVGSQNVNENASAGATCSGAIATSTQPMGMLSRNGGALLSGNSTSEEFPNTPDWIKKSVKQWKRQNKNLR
jgi:hypothetical protein